MPWPVHPNGLLGAQGDNDNYQISRSLRFNSGDLAYLSRTPSVEGNRKIWTWSGWMKRSSISGDQIIFSAGVSDTVRTLIYFDGTSSTFFFINNTGSGYFGRYLNAAFRDTSSWYHIIVSVDTNQATSSNRIKFYINGTLQASTAALSGDMPDVSTFVNNTNAHAIGRNPYDSTGHVNGYLAEINFIDGQALTPSSFGETDAITGRWKAKAYSGTYGTNGFYLKFADNSSTAALGTDSSGNGNTWTTNNFSVTAGAGNDSFVDSPTNYGSDTGAGGTLRGNYATLNPLVSAHTYSNGNLDVVLSTTGVTSIPSAVNSLGVSSGKWYFEFTPTVLNTGCLIGITATPASNIYPGGNSSSYGYYSVDGNKFNSGSGTAYGNSFTVNDIIGIAFDIDGGKIWFAKNGTWQASGNPASGTNAAFTSIASGTYFSSMHKDTAGAANASGTFNFGQRPFAYTAPTGFKALCTTNLTTPTIKKPSSYMDVVTYTGNGVTNSITGLGFSPDMVWLKGRSLAAHHRIYDTIRGVTKVIYPSLIDAEVTVPDANDNFVSFDSGGFTLGSTSGANGLNQNSQTFVAWAWDAGSSSVTNNSGSITSTVRANAQDGVSIVSANYTSGTQSYGHGLGAKPAMYIVKNRNASQNWQIWHKSLSNETTAYLQFNTSGEQTVSNMWSPSTTTTISLATGPVSAGDNFIAYVFAEIEGFSKFGSYTGNGSTDGPFVWCGFRPRWVMFKRTDATSHWVVYDTARNTFNSVDNELAPNNANSENGTVASEAFDILSNGLKIRSVINGEFNISGGTYIFAAFAEAPFKYARAR